MPPKLLLNLIRRLLFGGRRRRGDALIGLLVLVVLLLLLGYFKGHELRSSVEPVHIGDAPLERLASPDELEPKRDGRVPASQEPVVFLMQNVQNYFVDDGEGRSRHRISLKPIEEREAVADVIASAKPAVVGLIEIGGPRALQDLRERLRRRGLAYPYFVVLIRNGEDRALGILSQLPIIRNDSQADYPLFGQNRRKMLRGILDVTLQAEDGRRFRIFGAHLKSRVASDPAAASALRRNEARTLAMYVNSAMKKHPSMPVLIFGDWNDGPDDAAVQSFLSNGRDLTRLSPGDSDGQYWTLYYRRGKEYCTYDQIFVNSVLRKRMSDDCRSGIVDIKAADQASDHRAVWCEMR